MVDRELSYIQIGERRGEERERERERQKPRIPSLSIQIIYNRISSSSSSYMARVCGCARIGPSDLIVSSFILSSFFFFAVGVFFFFLSKEVASNIDLRSNRAFNPSPPPNMINRSASVREAREHE